MVLWPWNLWVLVPILDSQISTHPFHRNLIRGCPVNIRSNLVFEVRVSRLNKFLVMFGRMMLGKIICFVQATFAPINDKLALTYTISDPIKAHVNGFGSFFFSVLFASPTAVMLSVAMDVKGLRVAHFDERRLEGAGVFSIVKQCA